MKIEQLRILTENNRREWIAAIGTPESNQYQAYLFVDPLEIPWEDLDGFETVKCRVCKVILRICDHNPVSSFKSAQEWAKIYAEREQVIALHAPVKRGRAKNTLVVTPEIVAKAKVLHSDGMSMVKCAQDLNVNPAELSAALKEAGVMIKKGRRMPS